MKRYLSIYAMMWRNSVVREMQFKGNFLLWIVVELLWFALQLAFFSVIYSHTDHIGDWSKWEVILLLGASHFIQQVFQAFFLTNCVEISEYVRTGRLDFMLLQPINTRFMVSLRKVDLGAFVNAASALCVMGYALNELHYTPSLSQLLSFLLLAIVGIHIHYALMFILGTISFWTVRAQGIVWGYYNLINISRYPDTAYRGWFKAVFTWIIPMILVANVPVKVLIGRSFSGWNIAMLIGLAVGCFVASSWFWKWSLRRYTSASS